MGSLTHLPHEVLDDAVLRHLGADGKAAFELLLNAGQHLLVLLCCEAFCPCRETLCELSVPPTSHSPRQSACLLCLPPHLHNLETSAVKGCGTPTTHLNVNLTAGASFKPFVPCCCARRHCIHPHPERCYRINWLGNHVQHQLFPWDHKGPDQPSPEQHKRPTVSFTIAPSVRHSPTATMAPCFHKHCFVFAQEGGPAPAPEQPGPGRGACLSLS